MNNIFFEDGLIKLRWLVIAYIVLSFSLVFLFIQIITPIVEQGFKEGITFCKNEECINYSIKE